MLPTNDHSEGSPPIGTSAGGFIGICVLVLLIAAFLLLRRQQKMAAPPQLAEMPVSTQHRELQGCKIHELHNPRDVPELPSTLPELDCSVPKS